MSFELRATVYVRSGEGRHLARQTIEAGPFLDELAALLAGLDPDCGLVEWGADLEPEPLLAREAIERFSLQAVAGVLLRPGPGSWLRAALAAQGLECGERPMGALTLFAAAPLARSAGLSVGALAPAVELSIPWLEADEAEVVLAWLRTLSWLPQAADVPEPWTHCWALRGCGSRGGGAALPALQAGLGTLGWRPQPIPLSLPLHALALLAHPERFPRADGELRYEPLEAAFAPLSERRCEAIPPSDLQALERVALAACGFRHASGRELLLLGRPHASELSLLLGADSLRAGLALEEWELEAVGAVFRALDAEEAVGVRHGDPAWGPDGGAEARLTRGDDPGALAGVVVRLRPNSQ